MGWLSDNAETVNKWVDTVSKIAVMISLAVGGIWTYLIFVRKDAPALEFHAGLDTEIRWADSGDKDLCWGIVRATLKNEGIKPFNVTDVYLRGWYFSIAMSHGNGEAGTPAPEAGRPGMLDVKRIMSTPPIINKSFNIDNITLPDHDRLPGMVSHYPQGAEANQEVQFVFKRDPKSGVLFKVDVKTDENVPFVPSSYAADVVCGGINVPEAKQSPSK